MNGLDRMKKRMDYYGGDTSDGRNVRGKWLSFNSALNNSYQAEDITFNEQKCRCLINPDKLKADYDQKVISIDFKYGMKNGDVFYWDRTGCYWLVYLQDHCEEAYFRAEIRRCDYEIEINKHRYWVYLRGPVETAIVWRQKHQIEMNDLNYSILLYVTKNKETLQFFSRFQIVKFDGHNWRVAATDKYSQSGIIEVYLEEYFDNAMEDNMVIPEIVEPDKMHPYIDGPQVVRPYDAEVAYSIVGYTSGEFVVNSSKVEIIKTDEKSCKLNILTGRAGEFILTFTSSDDPEKKVELPIKIKSL